jgi:hypothetical protein
MLHVMDVSATELKRAVEAQHGCKATVFQSVPIKETFGRNTVWEGVVHIFSLTGHPTAKRAYAWSSPLAGIAPANVEIGGAALLALSR